jgi:hypothetical protein
MHRLLVALAFVVIGRLPAEAQFVVHDAAVTTRNSVTAVVKENLLETQRLQHERLRRMATRLSAHTNLDKYAPSDPPRWRARNGNALYSQAFDDALVFGDPVGGAYMAVSHPVAAANGLLSHLTPAARQALVARLATLNVADAAVIAATHDTGQLRNNGRAHELRAIDALERHVIDPSVAQSATAVLDKVGGAVLIGARQRQARLQLLTGVVEQLLVDSKRARDAEAALVNMQVVTWRDAHYLNHAFGAGTGDALRTWRQP